MKKGFFSGAALKYIAIAAMTIDHAAYVFVNPDSMIYYFMRLFGRLTAPIMCYFIVEGFIHTKNIKKYFLRMLIFAIISQPFYFIMIFSRTPVNIFEFFANLNVMFTFCLSLLSLIIMTNKKVPIIGKVILIGICFAAAEFCDWTYIIPAWTIIFFLFRNNKYMNVAFIIVSVLLLVQRFLPQYDSFIQFSYQLGVVLALIPLNFYNGKRNLKSSNKNKFFSQWIFYIYYPLHMTILILITNIDSILIR